VTSGYEVDKHNIDLNP